MYYFFVTITVIKRMLCYLTIELKHIYTIILISVLLSFTSENIIITLPKQYNCKKLLYTGIVIVIMYTNHINLLISI